MVRFKQRAYTTETLRYSPSARIDLVDVSITPAERERLDAALRVVRKFERIAMKAAKFNRTQHELYRVDLNLVGAYMHAEIAGGKLG